MMLSKPFTLALTALVAIALVGCSGGDDRTRRTSRKSKAETKTEDKSAGAKDGDEKAGDKMADAGAAAAEDVPKGEWGTLKGKFVFDGAAPAAEPVNVTKDQEFCGKHNLVNESIVVGDGGAMANVVIWVRTKGVEVHPDYEALKNEKVVLDNKNCRFDPHVQTYWTGQPIELKNSDPVAHNINAQNQVNAPFNEIVPAEKSSERAPLENAEIVPVKLTCNIHPWMEGWLVVQSNPYMAISGADGAFELKNLPTGTELEFQVWQEKSGYVTDAKLDGTSTKWERGRFTRVIKPGDNDLGEIKLDPAQFNK